MWQSLIKENVKQFDQCNSEIADELTYPIQRKNHQLNASLHHVAQDKLIWKFLFSLQADSDTNGAKSNMKWHLDFHTFPTLRSI